MRSASATAVANQADHDADVPLGVEEAIKATEASGPPSQPVDEQEETSYNLNEGAPLSELEELEDMAVDADGATKTGKKQRGELLSAAKVAYAAMEGEDKVAALEGQHLRPLLSALNQEPPGGSAVAEDELRALLASAIADFAEEGGCVESLEVANLFGRPTGSKPSMGKRPHVLAIKRTEGLSARRLRELADASRASIDQALPDFEGTQLERLMIGLLVAWQAAWPDRLLAAIELVPFEDAENARSRYYAPVLFRILDIDEPLVAPIGAPVDLPISLRWFRTCAASPAQSARVAAAACDPRAACARRYSKLNKVLQQFGRSGMEVYGGLAYVSIPGKLFGPAGARVAAQFNGHYAVPLANGHHEAIELHEEYVTGTFMLGFVKAVGLGASDIFEQGDLIEVASPVRRDGIVVKTPYDAMRGKGQLPSHLANGVSLGGVHAAHRLDSCAASPCSARKPQHTQPPQPMHPPTLPVLCAAGWRCARGSSGTGWRPSRACSTAHPPSSAGASSYPRQTTSSKT